jgi:hypothetical protein
MRVFPNANQTQVLSRGRHVATNAQLDMLSTPHVISQLILSLTGSFSKFLRFGASLFIGKGIRLMLSLAYCNQIWSSPRFFNTFFTSQLSQGYFVRKLFDADIFTLVVDFAIGSPRAAVAEVLILHPLSPILADTKTVPHSSQGLDNVIQRFSNRVLQHICVLPKFTNVSLKLF